MFIDYDAIKDRVEKEFECQHIPILAYAYDSIERPFYFDVCKTCGKRLTESKKRNTINTDEAVPYDPEQYQEILDKKNKLYQELCEIERNKNGKAIKNDYHEWLQTEEWKLIRDKKLSYNNKHNDGLCEGCLIRRATTVHHLNYDHATKPFYFELVAICQVCHEILHLDKIESVV